MKIAPVLAGFALLSISTLVHAQAPSKAQQDAIRSNCRSDFMRNCSSVTPGGREALECLMQNRAKTSAGCQGALNAIAAPAPAAAKPEPKLEPKAATAPKSEPAVAAPAATAPVHQATPAPAAKQPAAPKAATPKVTTPKPASAPKAAAVPARPAVPTAPLANAPAAVAPPPVTHQPKLGEAVLIRRFCTTDFRVLCKGVTLGQGRAIQCLANNGPALSPGCRQAMMQTGELRQ